MYINVPKVNDFYYVDYRNSARDRRSQQHYRIAKVVDITGGTVSLTYGNYFYPLKKSLKDAVLFGHSTHFDYFDKQRQNYSIKQLNRYLNKVLSIELCDQSLLLSGKIALFI